MEMPVDVLRRFMTKFHREGECWVWHAGKDPDGYGIFSLPGRKSARAHRVSYKHFVGPIPSGLTIDHKCRNRACVNPGHHEPVTGKENTLRGHGPSAKNAKKSTCKNGHAFTPENTYQQHGGRGCLTCRKEKTHARHVANYIPATPKTHCKHGHEFTAENTRTKPGRPKNRVCRSCERGRKRVV